MTTQTTQKISISSLENKAQFELSKEEKEAILEYLAERRAYIHVLKKKASGICGENSQFYRAPRIILTNRYNNSEEITLISTNQDGLGKTITLGVTKDEAVDLIEKLKAFVEITNTEGQISKVRYKVET